MRNALIIFCLSLLYSCDYFDYVRTMGDAETIELEMPEEDIALYDTNGYVLYLKDGDSFVMLNDQKQEVEVRLVDIDAPEKYQPFSNKSKAFLAKLIKGKEVGVNYKTIDRYNRILGHVYADGAYINLEMLRSGMAWHFRKYSNDKEFRRVSDSAQEHSVGLWSDPEAQAPWTWRKAH